MEKTFVHIDDFITPVKQGASINMTSDHMPTDVKTILIADCDPTIVSLLNKILSSKGYDVLLAEHGEAALEILKKHHVDLTITTIKMEPIDGMQLLKHVHKTYPEMQVIMLTAYATVATAVESMKEGAFDYLLKPFKIDEMLVTVKRALDYRQILSEQISKDNSDAQTAELGVEFEKGKHLKAFLRQKEKEYLRSVIDACNGDKVAAAKELDISLATLNRKLPEENTEQKSNALPEVSKQTETGRVSGRMVKIKKILSGIGQTGLVAGGGFLCLAGYILRFAFVGICGLAAIWISIRLFIEGSILWGILALFVGTPLAIWISSTFFPFLLCMTILTAVVWGCIRLFGGDTSFSSIWDGIWLVMQVLLIGAMAIFGVIGFIQSIRDKDIGSFFKQYSMGMLLFMFLFWLFFLT